MYLTTYKGDSIVNLMASIGSELGKKSKYNQLKILPKGLLKGKKTIILLVIDGLGYDFVKKNSKKFDQFIVGKMNSVFPPTTGAAITTYVTGVAPKQHGNLGWFIHLKSLGQDIVPLPFVTRGDGTSLTDSKYNIKLSNILKADSFMKKIKAKSYVIIDKKFSKTEYTKFISDGNPVLSYTNLNGLFSQMKKIVEKKEKKKYVYAYWSEFDSLSHKHGKDSSKVKKHFKQIEQKLMEFSKLLTGTNTVLIVTADHGQVVSKKEHRIDLRKHPRAYECLSTTLCGEPRAAYCYVYPEKEKQFVNYVKKHLSKYCTIYSRKQIVDWYGIGKMKYKVAERIGDYVLVTKGNYIIKDNIFDREIKWDLGNHGGISKEEREVPLIIFQG